MKWPLLFVVLLLFCHAASGQVKQRRSELNRLVPPATRLTAQQQLEAAKIFKSVQEGLEASSPNAVTGYFDRNVHLSLPGVEQGQFSRDQASQLLSSYVRSSRTISIEVKKREDSLASPYLSGRPYI